jgi:ribosomal protein S18 acetylase RimI-like enzyme
MATTIMTHPEPVLSRSKAVSNASSTSSSSDVTALKALQPAQTTSTAASATTWKLLDPKRVTAQDIADVTDTLLLAFQDDPVMRYFVDTPTADAKGTPEPKRLYRLRKLLYYTVHFHLLLGTITTMGPNHDSVALWVPPGPPRMNAVVGAVRSGLWRLHLVLDRDGRTRFFDEFVPLLTDTKTAVLGGKEREERDWYLVYLATRPAAQGRGYARRLIEAVFETADLEGSRVYLESSHEHNLPWYRRLGFVEQQRVWMGRGKEGEDGQAEDKDKQGLSLDIMIREPCLPN